MQSSVSGTGNNYGVTNTNDESERFFDRKRKQGKC